MSSSPAQAIAGHSPTPHGLGPVSLPEPMVIAVEASPATGMEGEVSVVCLPHQPRGDQSRACSHQDEDIVEIPAPQQGVCLAAGSMGQHGHNGPGGSSRMGSPGLSGQDQEVADRLRAAVGSRGFEPCPGSDRAASPEEAPGSLVGGGCQDTAGAASVSEQGPRAMVLCHADADAGELHWQSKLFSHAKCCEYTHPYASTKRPRDLWRIKTHDTAPQLARQ